MIKDNDQDPFVYWVVSGIIGVVVRDLYSLIAKLIGFAKFYIWNLGASLLVIKPEIKTFLGTILGLLVDITIGAMFGVVIGLLIEWRGPKNYLTKGWGIGVLAWLFFYGILYHNLPYTKDFAPSNALSNLSAFIGHSLFGIVTVIVYIKYFYTKKLNNYG